MSKWYRVEMKSLTCAVVVEDGVVYDTAPILKRFRGQWFWRLRDWVRSNGGKVRVMGKLSYGGR